MRIVAGEFKGHIIKTVESLHTRPTTNRVREAWASSVMSCFSPDEWKQVKILDAFAGSGALGIELLSRGAKSCCFVEQNKQSFAILKSNLAHIRIPEAAACAYKLDSTAHKSLELFKAQGPFDLVILDPPYALPLQSVSEYIHKLIDHVLLSSGAVISYEHAKEAKQRSQEAAVVTSADKRLTLLKSKTYGAICLDYYQYV